MPTHSLLRLKNPLESMRACISLPLTFVCDPISGRKAIIGNVAPSSHPQTLEAVIYVYKQAPTLAVMINERVSEILLSYASRD